MGIDMGNVKTLTRKKEVDSFLKDLIKVYNKHNMSLAHEDNQGAFVIEKNKDENVKWVKSAIINL